MRARQPQASGALGCGAHSGGGDRCRGEALGQERWYRRGCGGSRHGLRRWEGSGRRSRRWRQRRWQRRRRWWWWWRRRRARVARWRRAASSLGARGTAAGGRHPRHPFKSSDHRRGRREHAQHARPRATTVRDARPPPPSNGLLAARLPRPDPAPAPLPILPSSSSIPPHPPRYAPSTFLLSFEPLLDKYASLISRNSRPDTRAPLGHHHPRGLVLPFAVSSVANKVSELPSGAFWCRLMPSGAFRCLMVPSDAF